MSPTQAGTGLSTANLRSSRFQPPAADVGVEPGPRVCGPRRGCPHAAPHHARAPIGAATVGVDRAQFGTQGRIRIWTITPLQPIKEAGDR